MSRHARPDAVTLNPIIPYLRLVRAGTLFSPAADVIAGLCLVHVGWSVEAGRLIAASVFLYAGGMILNDHADRELDGRQRPERPIPSGQIVPAVALCLGSLCLALCLVLSPVPVYHGIMAILVVLYDYVLKRWSVLGALDLGALRAMNLLAPAALAVTLDSDQQRLLAIAGAGYGVYIIAVTFLGILEDAPRVGRRAVLGLVSIPPIAAALVIYALPEPWPAAAIASALAAVTLIRHRSVVWNQASIRGVMMWLLLGTMCFTALVALGSGCPIEAAVILTMVIPARVIARSISLT